MEFETGEVEDKKEFNDSIEWGSVAKDAKLKVYFSSDNVDEAKKRVDNAKAVKEYAMGIGAVNT